MEIDLDGNLLKRKFLRGNSFGAFNNPGDFHHLPAGNIAFTFSSTHFNVFPIPIKALLDSEYNYIWADTLSPSELLGVGRYPHLAVSPDSSVIYYAYIYNQERNPDRDGVEGYVEAVKSDGEILWKVWMPAGRFLITALYTMEDGHIIGTGFDRGVDGDWDVKGRARLFKISPDGKIDFDYRYMLPGRLTGVFANDWTSFNDVIVTSDGGFLCVGTVEPPQDRPLSDNWDVYVVKLDSNGCLSPDCDEIVFSVPPLSALKEGARKGQVKVFPNPARESFIIDFGANKNARISLFSLTGKRVFTKSNINSGSEIDISFLPEGIYFYQVQTIDNQYFTTGKLVKN